MYLTSRPRLPLPVHTIRLPQVHGSGSFVSALLIRHAMAILEGRARVPVTMTYRAVGSVEAQAELQDYTNMYQSYNHFKVGCKRLPGPLRVYGGARAWPHALPPLVSAATVSP
jgi:hypothetical protein